MNHLDPNDPRLWANASQCIFERIAEKWTLRIVGSLAMTPMTFLKLQRTLTPVSRKMLAETLRHLERDGLVARRPDRETSMVEYSLTGLGQSLCGPLDALRRWSEEHVDTVEGARRAYDRSDSAVDERAAAPGHESSPDEHLALAAIRAKR